MSQRHAAAKATRSAVGSFAKTPKPAPLAAAHLKDDVEFAKAFVQAALHGHSPLWKFYGWRNSAAERSKDPKINPHCYLRRDLIEGTSPSGSGASSYYSTPPPRKFLKEQAKLNYLRRFTRPFSTSAASRERYFKEEADEEDFEQEDPAEDADGLPALLLASAQRKLQPGDWVQMRIFNQSSGAIYLAEDKINAQRGGRRCLVHGFGNTLNSIRYEDILFTIPAVVPSNVAKDATRILGLSPQHYIEHLEEGDGVPSSAPATDIILDDQALWNEYGVEYGGEGWTAAFTAKSQCVAALRDMKIKQEKARGIIAAKGPRSLYERFVKGKSVNITTLEAYTALFGHQGEINIEDPDDANEKHRHLLLALHDALLDDSEHFVLHSFGTLLSSEFRVRPKLELENLREVREWVRRNSKQVLDFCEKATKRREKVAKARKALISALTTSSKSTDKPKVFTDKAKWTAEEVKIINFFRNTLEMRRALQVNPFEPAAALLLRRALALQPLESQRDDSVTPVIQARQAIIEFLKGIGVFEDWENLTLKDKEARLGERMKRLNNYKPDSSSTAQMENVDGLDSIRYDFGQLPVYVIDDLGASELDDGISVERCSPQPNIAQGRETYWIHVHIADPTSSLTPTSELATQARSFATAVYLPEFVSPMFPESAMKHYKWSLGSEAKTKGQRVLTFSARIDEQGEILEKMVRPGIVNNVFTTTYNKVNELLGASVPSAKRSADQLVFTWPTADMPPANQEPPRSLSALPSTAQTDFQLLHKLSRGLLKQRVKNGHITWLRGTSQTNLILGPRPFFASLDSDSSLNNGTLSQPPHLAFALPNLTPQDPESTPQSESVSGNLVAEFMIMAGQIAGSTLTSRGLPALYRAQDAPTATTPELLNQFMQSRNSETGLIDFEDQLEAGIVFTPAYFSSKPADHATMGIKGINGGYTQATSPLRRFNDMIVHWQLKSILRNEHGKSDIKPVFTQAQIDQHIKQNGPYERLMKKLDQRSRKFWKLFIIQKKLEQMKSDPSSDPQASELLHNGLTGKIINFKLDYATLRIVARLIIPELGNLIATLVLDPKIQKNFSVGSTFKVEIADIILDDFSRLFVKLRE